MSVMRSAGFWIAAIALLACAHAPRALAQTYPCPAATCVPITVNLNLNYTKLHPLVTNLQVVCSTQAVGYLSDGHTSLFLIENREFIRAVSVVIPIQRAMLSTPSSRTVNVECIVSIYRRDGTGGEPSASLSVPTLPVDSNYLSLDSQSQTRWSGEVTIPNTNAP